MANTLYLDCFSGISGDMFLGACLDLGLPFERLKAELSKLGLDAEFYLHADKAERCGIVGTHFVVHEQAHGHHHHSHEGHGHTHDHPHHHGRSYHDIEHLILESTLDDTIKARSLAVFKRIGEAEARIHGKMLNEIHFHEVGAIDSIVDIVSACLALQLLGVDKVLASPLVDGHGTLTCAHGTFPIPAPATLAILAGIPISQIDVPHELITPTGAALLAEFAASFAPLTSFKTEKIGYGIGTRDLKGRPNVLRALLGHVAAETHGLDVDTVLQFETNLDDCSGETLAYLSEKLLGAGALDVAFVPLTMKKSRPAVQLQVIAPETAQSAVTDLIFTESSAFGLRLQKVQRLKLQREIREVETPWGKVAVKLGLRNGQIVQASPEFESCRKIAEQSGQPLQRIYDAAKAATAL